MDSDTAVANKLAKEITKYTADRLRQEFPYMESIAVQRTSVDVAKELVRGINAAKPQMKASKANSGFFSLPAELRNEIYHIVLSYDAPNPWVAFREARRGFQKAKVPINSNVKFPNLLHASKHIRNEALPIFLSTLEVFVDAALYLSKREWKTGGRCEKEQLPLVKSWLAGLGKDKAKTIRRVELQVEGCKWASKPRRRQDIAPWGTKEEILEDLGLIELGLGPQAVTIMECKLPRLGFNNFHCPVWVVRLGDSDDPPSRASEGERRLVLMRG